MSEDLYAKVDVTKKVRFQTSEKEDTDADDNGNIDNVTIYDNCWAEGRTPPKSQDNTADDQRQTTSVNVSSGQRNLFKAAAVFLGLLCLVLLAAVIVLVVLWIQDKNNWRVKNERMTSEKDELLISYSEKESLNHNLTLKTSELEVMINNLTNERDELQTSYCELESLNHNLTLKINKSEATINNLTSERDELKTVIDTKCCPAQWNKLGDSCYFTSTSKETWHDSKKFCENENAHLLVISSRQEQKYFFTFGPRSWIGLTDEEKEGEWKWVNGEPVKQMFWASSQPDNYGKNEHCAELGKSRNFLNWNDFDCKQKLPFTCEKALL